MRAARRAIAAINSHGPASVSCILPGRLDAADVIAEAGLAVQPKVM